MAHSSLSSRSYNQGNHDAALDALLRVVETYRRYISHSSLLTFQNFLVVAARGPIGPSEIATLMGTTQGTVSGTLDCLGESYRYPPKDGASAPELVSCVAHPLDGRMKLAALTAKGNQLVAEMRAVLGVK